MKLKDAKITPMTLLQRPLTTTTTKGSIIEINSKPVESDKKHQMSMKPANHTNPQATRQPLLLEHWLFLFYRTYQLLKDKFSCSTEHFIRSENNQTELLLYMLLS